MICRVLNVNRRSYYKWQSNGKPIANNFKRSIADVILEEPVEKNTKARDALGNKITIPAGFRIVKKGEVIESKASNVEYSYYGDNGVTPCVQDGIVIIDDREGDTKGNQFVWIPVGTINNKPGSSKATTEIKLGRYTFDIVENWNAQYTSCTLTGTGTPTLHPTPEEEVTG